MDAKKLKLYLECPVCLSVPAGKILACCNGHKICEACFMKLKTDENSKKCPQGGCNYNNPPHRCRDLEAIVENSDVKLSCSRPGCNEEMTRLNIHGHEAKCKFRLVPCPKTSCQKKIKFSEILLHMQKAHEDRYKIIHDTDDPKLRSFSIFKERKDCTDWSLNMMLKNDDIFYPQFVERDGLFYFWVQIKGAPEIASKWRFSAKTENKDSGIRMEFSGTVHPVDVTVEEVIETEECLSIKRKNMEKLVSSDIIVISFDVFMG